LILVTCNANHETRNPKQESAVRTRMHLPTDKPSSDNHDKVILPLKVEAGEKRTDYTDAKRGYSRKLAYVISALLILTAGGFSLFSYLSRHPLSTSVVGVQKTASQEKPQEMLSTAPVQTPPQDSVSQEDTQGRKEAETKLADFLKAKKELDARGGAEWGGEQYQQMLGLSQAADTALMQEQFPAAAQGYSKATELVGTLMEGTDDVLRDAMARGEEALREGDGSSAERFFKRALLIDPVHTQAQHNLVRAKTCETVMQLIRSGAQHEQGNNLALAAADHREASRLDPESEEAQTALKRVTSLIAAQQFEELLSQGIAALHDSDYARARTLLLKARSFKPGAPEVNDALAQADSALKRARIDELKTKAINAEGSEDWNEALAAYQAVLAIDGSIQFALQGRERTLKRSQLEERMRSYLNRPTSLEADQSLNRATELLNEARQTEPRGPRFSNLIREFDALITSAGTPIPVTIESDGITEVMIYKVGRLGHFKSKELTLRPGTYTITGARTGYKDVRHTLSVKAGNDSIRFTVTCNEKI